jgi:hypothetical protein
LPARRSLTVNAASELYLGVRSTATAADTAVKSSGAAKSQSVDQLEEVAGLSSAYISAMTKDPTDRAEREAIMSLLDESQRTRVESTFSSYDAIMAGSALGTGGAGVRHSDSAPHDRIRAHPHEEGPFAMAH